MDEHKDVNLARRASPYGLAVLPQQEIYEYTDPRNEVAVERRWRPICEQHGAAVIGIRDVPSQMTRLNLDGIDWDLGPLGSAERGVPTEVFHRWRALEAAGVPMMWWLWGEEQPQRPRFRPLTATKRPLSLRWAEAPDTLRDPLVIGVIPTAPNRGVWVVLGRWFH